MEYIKTPMIVPPPPPYPAEPGAELPAGVTLPEAGTKAAFEELEKIGEWEPASRPLGKGIVRPKPKQAAQDFLELIPTFLEKRGLTQEYMEYVGEHNGWLEYWLKKPALKSDQARTVAENWNDETKWPSNWVSAYHGSRWYAFWSICTEGFINISVRGDPKHQAGGGTGHYCAHDFEYARWFSRPQVLFADGCYHRVMFRLAYNTDKLKNIRYVSQGLEHVVEEDGIVLLSCLMKPNYPPVEATEERFSSWNPLLEVHPWGTELAEISPVVNQCLTPWGPWEDYGGKEKKRLSTIASENRGSQFTKGFGSPKPMESETSYFAPDKWMLGMFSQHQVVPAKKDAGFYCELCGVYVADHSCAVEHCRSLEHLTKLSARPSGIWGLPGEGAPAASSGQVMGSSSGEPSRKVAAVPDGIAPQMGSTSFQAAEQNTVQVLTEIPGIMQAASQEGKELTLEQIAMSSPHLGTVLEGASFWIADSGLTCTQTKSPTQRKDHEAIHHGSHDAV
jgi:hypothetical protein